MDDHPVRPLPLDGLEVIDLGTMVGAVVHAQISEEEREQLFWKTAARIFQIDLVKFKLTF